VPNSSTAAIAARFKWDARAIPSNSYEDKHEHALSIGHDPGTIIDIGDDRTSKKYLPSSFKVCTRAIHERKGPANDHGPRAAQTRQDAQWLLAPASCAQCIAALVHFVALRGNAEVYPSSPRSSGDRSRALDSVWI